jgi:hypothetical protein
MQTGNASWAWYEIVFQGHRVSKDYPSQVLKYIHRVKPPKPKILSCFSLGEYMIKQPISLAALKREAAIEN